MTKTRVSQQASTPTPENSDKRLVAITVRERAMTEPGGSTILPPHIEATVAAIARLHAEHHKRATPFQRFTENFTARAGQSIAIAWIGLSVAGWICFNLALMALGLQPIDPPPFYWLGGFASVAALLMTVMILSTQRREDELASHREQLTLELAILGDQKAAKIIELFEELRRDSPSIHNRVDHDANAMSMPADPEAVFDAIKDSHKGLVRKNPGA